MPKTTYKHLSQSEWNVLERHLPSGLAEHSKKIAYEIFVNQRAVKELSEEFGKSRQQISVLMIKLSKIYDEVTVVSEEKQALNFIQCWLPQGELLDAVLAEAKKYSINKDLN